LVEQFRCLKDVVASGIYKRGLKRIAADLNTAPGNLSVMLSDSGERHFGVDLLEEYIQKTGDLMPVQYLIARYMQSAADSEAATLKRVEEVMDELASFIGRSKTAARKARR
jgi:hypothetical protein